MGDMVRRMVPAQASRAGGATLALCWLLLGCGAKQGSVELPPETAKPLEEPSDGEEESSSKQASDAPSLPWAETTFSPRPGSAFDPDLEPLVEVCGTGDVGLHETAEWVARMHADKEGAPDLDDVNFHLRRYGSPYVMPRLWSATMAGVSDDELLGLVEKWASAREPMGEYRCGAGAFEDEDGTRTVSVVQVDVLAELSPLPTQVEPGQWLDLETRFLVPTTAASIVLLPPEGAPRNLNTEDSMGGAKARFNVETPGTWLVQVMATMVGGPRPVASALITAGGDPPSAVDDRPVPGEEVFDPSLAPADALFSLVNAARREEGLPQLRRNKKLDQVAREHCLAMRDAGRIGHDTGRGDPAYRVAASGLSPKATGENVALAATVPRLHRVLWASPSHRGNLLLRRWDQAGVAVVARDDGTLYATQLFIDQD